MICTTLRKIRAAGPCEDRWGHLLRGLGKTEADDEPLPLARIVDTNGLLDALWACKTLPQHDRLWRLFAVWCARRVQHLMVDPHSITALDVAERYARGEATDAELREAAEAASWAVARAAARAAAWAAARAAAWAATELTAEQTTRASAGAGERKAQIEEFLRIVTEEDTL